jgi:hypothetical protein
MRVLVAFAVVAAAVGISVVPPTKVASIATCSSRYVSLCGSISSPARAFWQVRTRPVPSCRQHACAPKSRGLWGVLPCARSNADLSVRACFGATLFFERSLACCQQILFVGLPPSHLVTRVTLSSSPLPSACPRLSACALHTQDAVCRWQFPMNERRRQLERPSMKHLVRM